MSNPDETPTSDISVAQRSQSYVYVGFWQRVIASLIDTLLLLMMITPLIIAFFGLERLLDQTPQFSWLAAFINYILPALAVMVFWSYRSTTPGKMVFKAVIIDAKSGGKMSMGQVLGRYLCYYVAALPLFLGFFWVGWDKKKQGFHDKIAGTLVVRFTGQDD